MVNQLHWMQNSTHVRLHITRIDDNWLGCRGSWFWQKREQDSSCCSWDLDLAPAVRWEQILAGGLDFINQQMTFANLSDINTSIACVSFMTLTNWKWSWDVGLCYIYSLTREVNIWVLQSLPHLLLSVLYYSYITVTRKFAPAVSSTLFWNDKLPDDGGLYISGYVFHREKNESNKNTKIMIALFFKQLTREILSLSSYSNQGLIFIQSLINTSLSHMQCDA